MKHFMVAIRDMKGEYYRHLTFVQRLVEIERTFETACKDTKTFLGEHPRDYRLEHIGYWDDTTGEFENIKPTIVVTGEKVYNEIQREMAEAIERMEEKNAK